MMMETMRTWKTRWLSMQPIKTLSLMVQPAASTRAHAAAGKRRAAKEDC